MEWGTWGSGLRDGLRAWPLGRVAPALPPRCVASSPAPHLRPSRVTTPPHTPTPFPTPPPAPLPAPPTPPAPRSILNNVAYFAGRFLAGEDTLEPLTGRAELYAARVRMVQAKRDWMVAALEAALLEGE